MSRMISKEELREAFRHAEVEEKKHLAIPEFKVETGTVITDPEAPKPRKKPGPKPGTKRAKTKNTDTNPKSTRRKKKATETETKEIAIQVIDETMTEDSKRKEAIRAAIQIMVDYTDGLILKADKLVNMADIYSGYITTLEEMTK